MFSQFRLPPSLLTEDKIDRKKPLYQTMSNLYIKKGRRELLEAVDEQREEAGPSGCFGPCMRARS